MSPVDWVVVTSRPYYQTHGIPLAQAYHQLYGRSLAVCLRPSSLSSEQDVTWQKLRKVQPVCLCLDLMSVLFAKSAGCRSYYLHHSLVSKGIFNKPLRSWLSLLFAEEILLPSLHLKYDLPVWAQYKARIVGHLPLDPVSLEATQYREFDKWKKTEAFRILLLPTYQANELLEALLDLMDCLSSQPVSFAVRAHPALKFNFPTGVAQLSNVPMPALLRAADLVVTGYSSTALEAYKMGVTVLIIKTEDPSWKRMPKGDYEEMNKLPQYEDLSSLSKVMIGLIMMKAHNQKNVIETSAGIEICHLLESKIR
jgi:hypothetical protein